MPSGASAGEDGGDESLGRRIVSRAGRSVARPARRLERALTDTGALLGTIPALAVAFGDRRRRRSDGGPGNRTGRDGSPQDRGNAGRVPAGGTADGAPGATERVHRAVRADVRGAVPADGGVTHWGTTAADSHPSLWLSGVPGGTTEPRRPLEGDGFDVARALTRAHDDGVVLAGNRSPAADAAASDAVVLAVDPTGKVRARHAVDRPAFACCSALCRSADGGYLLAGGSMGADETHTRPWVLKLDGELNPVWRTNGVRGAGDCPRIVRDRGDRIVLIDGRGGPDDPHRFRTLDRDGTPTDARPIEGTAGVHVRAAAETEAGGLVLAGHRLEAAGTPRLWVATLDRDGRRRWDRTYRRAASSIGHDVVETASGLAVAGERTGATGRRWAAIVTIDRSGTWRHEWTFERGASARSVWVSGDGSDGATDAAAEESGPRTGDRGADGRRATERLGVAGIALDGTPRRPIPWDGTVPTVTD